MHLARVHVHVIVLVVDVVCLMLVLSALVVLHAVFVVFPQPVSQVNRPFTDFRKFSRSISVKSIVAVMSQMRDATRNLAIATKTRKSFAAIFGGGLDPLHS